MPATNATKKPKTIWRYRITKVTGSMRKTMKRGDVIGQWRSYGERYTWLVMNVTNSKIDGTFTGELIGTGRLSADGKRLL